MRAITPPKTVRHKCLLGYCLGWLLARLLLAGLLGVALTNKRFYKLRCRDAWGRRYHCTFRGSAADVASLRAALRGSAADIAGLRAGLRGSAAVVDDRDTSRGFRTTDLRSGRRKPISTASVRVNVGNLTCTSDDCFGQRAVEAGSDGKYYD